MNTFSANEATCNKGQHNHITFNKDWLVGWLIVLRINVYFAIFQSYLDLEAGDNQSLKIQVVRPGIEPRSSCSASQELNHSPTAAPDWTLDSDNNSDIDIYKDTTMIHRRI